MKIIYKYFRKKRLKKTKNIYFISYKKKRIEEKFKKRK